MLYQVTDCLLIFRLIASIQAILSILGSTVFNTIEASDAFQFATRCSILLPAFFYGFLWFLVSICLIIASIVLAIIFNK